MYRRFIAGVIAAAMTITAFGVAPARADDRDIARAVAVILGVAIVGKIIHDKKKDREEDAATRYREPVYQPPRVHRPDRVNPRPLPDRVHRGDRRLLPGQCFRSFDTRRGPVRLFESHCLQQNFRYSHRLPQQCAQQIRTRSGRVYGYEARCLRDAGYSLARG